MKRHRQLAYYAQSPGDLVIMRMGDWELDMDAFGVDIRESMKGTICDCTLVFAWSAGMTRAFTAAGIHRMRARKSSILVFICKTDAEVRPTGSGKRFSLPWKPIQRVLLATEFSKVYD